MRLMPLLATVSASILLLAATAHGQARIGQPPPPLSVGEVVAAPEDADLPAAGDLRWEALEGKVVVLEFWATWCAPCIAAIPHLNELAEENPEVVFIAITAEERPVVEQFLERRPINGLVVLDEERKTNEAFAIRGIPHTVIVGKDGKVAHVTHPMGLTSEMLAKVGRGEEIVPPCAGGAGETVPARRMPGSFRPGQFPGDEGEPLFQVILRPTVWEAGGGGGWGQGRLTQNAQPAEQLLRSGFSGRLDVRAELPEGRFDLAAWVPQDRPEMLAPLVRQALEVSFNIRAFEEDREVDVWLLQVADGGPRMEETVSTGGASTTTRPDPEGGVHFEVVNGRMAGLAGILERHAGQPVIDESGLEAGFDYELALPAEAAEDPEAANEALARLGLELVPARRTLRYTVIENAQP